MGDGDFKVLLKEMSLFCRKVRPSDAVRLAHIKALQLGMASYPLRRVEVKTFAFPQGNLSWVKENVFLGQLPKRMVVGFVDNTAFNGQFNKNPFFYGVRDITTALNFLFQNIGHCRYNVIYSKSSLLKLLRCVK